MALIKCPECGKTISDKAPACIGCGCPVSEMNLTNVQPMGRAQRRRRYQDHQANEAKVDLQPAPPASEPTAQSPANTAASLNAVFQQFFTSDSSAVSKPSATPAHSAAPQRVHTSPENTSIPKTQAARKTVQSPRPPQTVANASAADNPPAKGIPPQKPVPAIQPQNQSPAKPAKTVPSEMPEYGFFFGILMTLLREGIGVLSYAAVVAVILLVVEFLSSGNIGHFLSPEIVLGLASGYLVANLVVYLDFLRAKHFLRKGGYLDAIRNDGPDMTNCISAYKLHASRSMLRYIKRLNPAHGAKLAQWLKEAKRKKRKQRLHYLPYALALAAVFYLLPRYEMIYDLLPQLQAQALLFFTIPQMLLIEQLFTFAVVTLYSRNNWQDTDPLVLELMFIFTGLFALMLYVHDWGDHWYHILINAIIVFISIIIGSVMGEKKKK